MNSGDIEKDYRWDVMILFNCEKIDGVSDRISLYKCQEQSANRTRQALGLDAQISMKMDNYIL